ncbi:hypothetical protein B0H10DRAFT_1951788 [Mycena sp. CBHHK59/15]|nr:hypothetical protein B0H10DRAFT_1951788 [Mycena sp. CBHHK59/15]
MSQGSYLNEDGCRHPRFHISELDRRETFKRNGARDDDGKRLVDEDEAGQMSTASKPPSLKEKRDRDEQDVYIEEGVRNSSPSSNSTARARGHCATTKISILNCMLELDTKYVESTLTPMKGGFWHRGYCPDPRPSINYFRRRIIWRVDPNMESCRETGRPHLLLNSRTPRKAGSAIGVYARRLFIPGTPHSAPAQPNRVGVCSWMKEFNLKIGKEPGVWESKQRPMITLRAKYRPLLPTASASLAAVHQADDTKAISQVDIILNSLGSTLTGRAIDSLFTPERKGFVTEPVETVLSSPGATTPERALGPSPAHNPCADFATTASTISAK